MRHSPSRSTPSAPRWAWSLACALLVLAACGDEADDGPPPEASFVTYNTGLARGTVDHAEARLQPVADAVAQVDADAACLQEVWLVKNDDEWSQEQIETINSTASDQFPHSYHRVTEPPEDDGDGDGPACTQAESTPLQNCVEAQCGDVAPEDLSGCALQNCGEEFGAVSNSCQSCITSNLGQPIDEIISTCREGGDSLFSNGHNGLLLLSQHPLEETEHLRMESTIAQRSALHATIDLPEVGGVDLYCTHLAAKLESVPYPGETYDSYEEEQAAQIDRLLDWIEETSDTGNVVLMGDMNTGPQRDDIQAELPDNFAKFRQTMLRAHYLESDPLECTYCGSNTLVDGEARKVIDHVFVNFSTIGIPDVSRRILDETRDIETGDGLQQLPLSDHFGVETNVVFPNPAPASN